MLLKKRIKLLQDWRDRIFSEKMTEQDSANGLMFFELIGRLRSSLINFYPGYHRVYFEARDFVCYEDKVNYFLLLAMRADFSSESLITQEHSFESAQQEGALLRNELNKLTSAALRSKRDLLPNDEEIKLWKKYESAAEAQPYNLDPYVEIDEACAELIAYSQQTFTFFHNHAERAKQVLEAILLCRNSSEAIAILQNQRAILQGNEVPNLDNRNLTQRWSQSSTVAKPATSSSGFFAAVNKALTLLTEKNADKVLIAESPASCAR